MDRSASPEERLSEEETAEVEAGTGRKVEKRDAKGKIYIGFDKNDPNPRAGRQGRMIDDDEERYPSRSEMAGGWAGGEKGLRAFIAVTGFYIQSVAGSFLSAKTVLVFKGLKGRLPTIRCAVVQVEHHALHIIHTRLSHAFKTV